MHRFQQILDNFLFPSFKGMRAPRIGRFFGFYLFNKTGTLDTRAPSLNTEEGAWKDFYPSYQQHIVPLLTQFEEKRLIALDESRLRFFFSLPLFGLVIWLGFHLNTLYIGVLVVPILYWMLTPCLRHTEAIKQDVFPHVFRHFGPDFMYRGEKRNTLPFPNIEEWGIVPSYTKAESEDYIKGSHKGVTIEMAEATLTERRGKKEETVFDGVMLVLSMNKNFTGKTIVKTDYGAIGNFLTETLGSLQRVRLEDPVFEKKFEVFSDDQIQARYLLTTSFMERLTALKELYKSTGIECSFYKNKVFFLIRSDRNRFEPHTIYEPTDFIVDINTIFFEMNEILQMIDTLKLDERTGL